MANLKKSNAIHKRLATLNQKKQYSSKSSSEYSKYQVRKGYHNEVAVCQAHIGRVLTKSEKKKAFAIMKKHSGNADLRGLFTK